MFRSFLSLSCFLLVACQESSVPTESIEVANVGLHSGALSQDGQYASIASIYHGGSLWRIEDSERIYNWNHQTDEPSTIIASDFDDEGQFVVTAEPHTLVLWELKTGRATRFWTAPAEILDIELNRTGSLALLGLEDHSAVIFDIRRGGILRTFNHQNRVRSVDFNLDGNLAITGSEDYTATIWDVKKGKQISQIKHHDDVQLVKLSDDGLLALSVSKYDKAIIWNTQTAELIGEVPLSSQALKRGTMFSSARFNHNNTQLLTGRPDKVIQLWQLNPLKEIYKWTLPKRNPWKPVGSTVLDVAFTEKENHFTALGSAGFIHHLTKKE